MFAVIVTFGEGTIMYPGGKGTVFRKIINQMPPHGRYFELFLGDGAVMRSKRPGMVNVGVDLDPGAITAVAAAIARSGDGAATPDVAIAPCTLVPSLFLAMTPGRPSTSPETTMLTVQYEFGQMDALMALRTWEFRPDDLIYLDPPYLMSARRSQRPLYPFEFGREDQHLELLTAAKQLNCMVVLSGYWSELYAAELAGWRTVSFTAVTRGGTLAEEWLWMNFPEPVRLHDYQWLGENFRERERIGRKARRWVEGLQRLPVLEQRAILAEMVAAGLVD